MSHQSQQRGFSLVELIMVVSIVGIISVVAVPSLLGARTAAQKGAALTNLQTMLKAEYSLKISTGRFARISEINQFYGGSLGQINVQTLTRQGYVYQTIPSAPTDAQLADSFKIAATGPGPDGITPFIFILDESGVISQYSP